MFHTGVGMYFFIECVHSACQFALLFLRQHHIAFVQHIISQYVTTNRHLIKNKIVIAVVTYFVCVYKYQIVSFIQCWYYLPGIAYMLRYFSIQPRGAKITKTNVFQFFIHIYSIQMAMGSKPLGQAYSRITCLSAYFQHIFGFHHMAHHL